MALVGCTMVGDKLTGVGLSRFVPTTCMKQCSDRYRALFDQARKAHVTNVELCRSLSQPEKGACLEAEGARHAVEMDRLSHALADCHHSCQEQGGGTAG